MPSNAFADRHIGLDPQQEGKMLALLGYASSTDLLRSAVPRSIQTTGDLDVPGPLSEAEALAAARRLADQNEVFVSLIGMGWYD